VPIYVFRAEDGETIEVFAPMAEAPPYGSTKEIGGKTFTRTVEIPGQGRTLEYRHLAYNFAPWQPGFKKYTQDGIPIVETKADAQHFEAYMGHSFKFRPGSTRTTREGRDALHG
jgi:hypothetical protein